MRAFVQRAFGGPEVVALEEIPDPRPAPGEVLVRVRACGLNRLDLLQREAPLVRGFTLPHIAGLDVAGVVEAYGADPPPGAPPVGTEVLIDPVSTCGVCDRCTSGKAPYCEQLRTVGSTRPGGFAELVTAPATHVYPLPAGMDAVAAAAIPVAYMTAFHALVTVGEVRPGEVVLVNAAGSGVSTAVVQFAKAAGARVIGTVGGAGKVEPALRLGCDQVIDHTAVDVAATVAEYTGGHGADLVIDHVGPALFQASIDALALDGRMVFCGTTTGTEVTINLPRLYHWGRRLLGAGGTTPEEFRTMLDAVATAGLQPVIDSVWPFEQLPAAQARMAQRDFFGKIVLAVS